MEKILLATNLNNPLRQLALELVLALSNRFALQGRIDFSHDGEAQSFSYQGAHEAAGILSNSPEVSGLSIQDQTFSVLLDQTQTGIELSYAPVIPPADSTSQDDATDLAIESLSRAILVHLEAMPGFSVQSSLQAFWHWRH